MTDSLAGWGLARRPAPEACSGWHSSLCCMTSTARPHAWRGAREATHDARTVSGAVVEDASRSRGTDGMTEARRQRALQRSTPWGA